MKKIAYIINHLSFFYSHIMPHALRAQKAGYEIKVFCGQPLSFSSEKYAKKKYYKKIFVMLTVDLVQFR